MSTTKILHEKNCKARDVKPRRVYVGESGRFWPAGWMCESCGGRYFDPVALLR